MKIIFAIFTLWSLNTFAEVSCRLETKALLDRGGEATIESRVADLIPISVEAKTKEECFAEAAKQIKENDLRHVRTIFGRGSGFISWYFWDLENSDNDAKGEVNYYTPANEFREGSAMYTQMGNRICDIQFVCQ